MTVLDNFDNLNVKITDLDTFDSFKFKNDSFDSFKRKNCSFRKF